MTEIVSIKTSVGKINLFATLKGSGTTKTFNLPHYMYNVKIWSGNGEMSVVFHDSNANYNKNIKTMNEEALKNALRCVLDDIALYLNDECDNRVVEKACKKEYEQFSEVVGGKENVWKAINELDENLI